jgi:hypothetical protein
MVNSLHYVPKKSILQTGRNKHLCSKHPIVSVVWLCTELVTEAKQENGLSYSLNVDISTCGKETI